MAYKTISDRMLGNDIDKSLSKLQKTGITLVTTYNRGGELWFVFNHNGSKEALNALDNYKLQEVSF